MTISAVATAWAIDLGRDRPETVEAVRRCNQLTHGLAGRAEPGTSHDIFVAAGDRWRPSGRRLVLGALESVCVQVVSAPAVDGFAFVGWWHRAVSAARRQVRRLHWGPVGLQPWI